MVSMTLTCSWLKFIDMPLFTMRVVICIQIQVPVICRLRVCPVQEADPSGSKTWRLDVCYSVMKGTEYFVSL